MPPDLVRATLAAARSGLPVALLLALAVGSVVAVGAQLSNATPSQDRPFGWPGPANFEGGVATVRPQLVLAATLPALLLGLRTRTGAEWAGRKEGPLAGTLAAGLLVPGALLAATLVGAYVAAPSRPGAYLAFWVAHSLLALAAFALGLLARAVTPRQAALAALAAWGLFAFVLDDVVRWQLFRQEGFHNLAAGQLPGWFYAAQVLSPIAAYRALLIVWQPGFRDWIEHAALDGAALPAWLTPGTLALALLVVWVLVPLGAAAAVIRWRRRTSEPLRRLVASLDEKASMPPLHAPAQRRGMLPMERPRRPSRQRPN